MRDFLESVRLILSLSAPGAAKFEKPLALSYKESSSFAEMTSSSIVKPIRYEGVLVYGSNTIFCVATSTKVPLIKNTPSPIEAAEPTEVAFSDTKVATVSPASMEVFPYVKPSSTIRTSPSEKVPCSPSSPPLPYLTNRVRSSMSEDIVDVRYLSTTATTPEVCPLNFLPTNLSAYTETSMPR